MNVQLKHYTTKDSFDNNTPSRVESKKSIAEAIKYIRPIIKKHRGSLDFYGFIIEDMTGQVKHKLHNQR